MNEQKAEDDITIKPKKKDFSWKKLFAFDFKKDWKTVLFIVWIVYMGWAFNIETSECRNIVSNPKPYCTDYCESIEGLDLSSDSAINSFGGGNTNFNFSTE